MHHPAIVRLTIPDQSPYSIDTGIDASGIFAEPAQNRLSAARLREAAPELESWKGLACKYPASIKPRSPPSLRCVLEFIPSSITCDICCTASNCSHFESHLLYGSPPGTLIYQNALTQWASPSPHAAQSAAARNIFFGVKAVRPRFTVGVNTRSQTEMPTRKRVEGFTHQPPTPPFRPTKKSIFLTPFIILIMNQN